jgi:hypothetical protein
MRSFILFISLIACNVVKEKKLPKNFNDTITTVKKTINSKGDTQYLVHKSYFISLNHQFDTSQFYYLIYQNPRETYNSYKIYFNRNEVIKYCDSVIKEIYKEQNVNSSNRFYDLITFEHIKHQAISNKMDSMTYLDEPALLLDKLVPTVIKANTNEQMAYLLAELEIIEVSRYLSYSIITTNNDTIKISTKIYPEKEVKEK